MGWYVGPGGVSRVEEGPKQKTQSIPRWNATIWQPKIFVPALPSPGPTYQVASIHEPGGSRGSAGWKKDKKKQRNRYFGGMLPFGNPKSLYSSSLTWAYIPGGEELYRDFGLP